MHVADVGQRWVIFITESCRLLRWRRECCAGREKKERRKRKKRKKEKENREKEKSHRIRVVYEKFSFL